MKIWAAPSFEEPIGLFPLPNAVLLPGATLPLHIHEARYRRLVRDALSEDSVMAMGFLLPGYEPYYHTLIARIHPTVCVGVIRDFFQTGDGRFLINLVGLCRARVVDEDRSGEYRRVRVEPIKAAPAGQNLDGEFAAVELCRQMLNAPAFDALQSAQKLRTVVGSSTGLEHLVDLMAAALIPAEAVEVKQLILSEPNLLHRTEILLHELAVVRNGLTVQQSVWQSPAHLESNN